MFKLLKKNKKYSINSQKGMTLIELLVVLAIFIVISTIVMYDYSSFKSSVSTNNLADDIALSIRKAQSYAIGVRGLSADFQYGHGAHFSTVTNPANYLSGSGKSFILFADINVNNYYNYNTSNICNSPSYSNECEEILNITSNDKISSIWVDGVQKPQGGTLDIVFRRPDPDALFCYRPTSGSSCQTNISNVSVEVDNGLTGSKRVTKKITVWNTGQISSN